MFTARMQAFGRRIAETAARPLAAIGLTPNTVTIVGLLLNAAVAVVLASGHLRWGGALLLVVGAFDMLDGALARITSQFTTFGAFLDSVLDRYSEAFIVLGLVYHEHHAGNGVAVMLLVAMLIGSFMISYTRARAEGLGLECKVGLLPRPERIIILAIGLLLPILVPILIVLTVLTNLTAVQRIHHVWNSLRSTRGGPARAESRPVEPANVPVATGDAET